MIAGYRRLTADQRRTIHASVQRLGRCELPAGHSGLHVNGGDGWPGPATERVEVRDGGCAYATDAGRKVTTYRCKAPLKGTIRVMSESIDGSVYVECDFTHTDWREDHPERWVGDSKRVPFKWVLDRVHATPGGAPC